MKILLIDPPYTTFTGYNNRYFPVGLSYVGAVLKENGHEVMTYEVDRALPNAGDMNFSEEYKRLQLYLEQIKNTDHFIWREIKTVVSDYQPDVIGITAMTMKFGSVVRTAQLCKKVLPCCRVVVGGPHATDWPSICFQCPEIDYCVSGEGEETIVGLLKAIEAGASDVDNLPGVSFRKNGRVVLSQETAAVSDLDRYPLPARELLMNQDRYTSEDMGVIMTSRGCPFKCGFCSHSPKVRYRSLDNVIDEIEYVSEKYGTRQFAIKDDSFTVNRKRTIEFCRLLKKCRLNINFDCTTRVNLIDDELLDIMQRAGCNTIKVGIETGSERILKEVNKGITFDQARKTAKLLDKHGIFWSAYFMYGLPTETKEDMLKTVEFMKELNPPYAGLGLYAPMPNTQLWQQGLQLGLVEPDISINHFFETNPKDYFFKDYKRRVVAMKHHKFMELAEYLMNEFNRHNTHWTRMLKRGWARRLTYRKNPRLMGADVKKAFKWAFG